MRRTYKIKQEIQNKKNTNRDSRLPHFLTNIKKTSMFSPLTRTFLILFLYKSNTWQMKRLQEKPIHLFLPAVSWLETTFCLTFWFVILHLKEMFAHRELLMYHAVKHRAVGSLLQSAIEVLRFLVVETALPVQEETKWSSGKSALVSLYLHRTYFLPSRLYEICRFA